MTSRQIRNWVVAARGSLFPNSPWSGKLTPLYATDAAAIVDANGHLITPFGAARYIGYLGDGVFWTAKNSKLLRTCTYPWEVMDGKFTLIREGAESIMDLDDVSPYWSNGLGLVMRGGKVAMVDSLLQPRTGFDFDRALVGPVRRFERDSSADSPLWLWALRATDGKWKVVDPGGELRDADWPTGADLDEMGIHIRGEGDGWLYIYRRPLLACFLHLWRENRPHYHPSSLSFSEIFPSEDRLSQYCDSLREVKLAEEGLELRHRGDKVALAEADGRRITPYGNDRFEPAQEGWVRQIRTYEVEVNANDVTDGFEDFAPAAGDEMEMAPYSQSVQKLGLVRRHGRGEIPCLYDQIRILTDWHLIEAEYEGGGALYDAQGKLLKEGLPLNFYWTKNDLIAFAIGNDVMVWDHQGRLIHQDTGSVHDVVLDGDWVWVNKGYPQGYFAHSFRGSKVRLGPVFSSEHPAAAYRYQQAHPDIACDSCYIDSMGKGLWRFGKRGMEAMADSSGKWLIAPDAGFQQVTLMEAGFKIEKDDLAGYADARGKVLYPPQFDSVYDLSTNRIQLKRTVAGREESAVIDWEGKIVEDWK